MKCVSVFFLLGLILNLSACASSSSLDRHNCSQEACIEVRVVEPIRFGEPITVTITVTAEKDIPKLGVSLYHDVDVIMEGPQGWEKEVRNAWKGKAGASWEITAKANQSMRFTRTMRLPSREGFFEFIGSASIPGARPTDSVRIHLTHAGGKVYLSGTSVPITPGPAPTITPGPSPTFIPTPARFVSPLPTPMRSLSPLATPTRSTTP